MPILNKISVSSGQQTIDIYIGDLPLLKSLDGTAVDEISIGYSAIMLNTGETAQTYEPYWK